MLKQFGIQVLHFLTTRVENQRDAILRACDQVSAELPDTTEGELAAEKANPIVGTFLAMEADAATLGSITRA